MSHSEEQIDRLEIAVRMLKDAREKMRNARDVLKMVGTPIALEFASKVSKMRRDADELMMDLESAAV